MPSQPNMIVQLVPMILIFGIFYFLVIIPEKKKPPSQLTAVSFFQPTGREELLAKLRCCKKHVQALDFMCTSSNLRKIDEGEPCHTSTSK